MAYKDQHYVPEAYLRAWESSVYKHKKPQNVFQGVRIFNKKTLAFIDSHKVDKICYNHHTYSVTDEYSFVMYQMPKIQCEYAEKIAEILLKHNAVAFFNGQPLDTPEKLVDINNFNNLGQWEFLKAYDTTLLASKKAIISEIKNIYIYAIEHALDTNFEHSWRKKRDNFISSCMHSKQIDKNFLSDIIWCMLILICRNPQFDCLGLFERFAKIIREISDTDEIADMLIRAAWLDEIYKGIFNIEEGYCYHLKNKLLEDASFTLMHINDEEMQFITSDTPAFMNTAVKELFDGCFIFPLTPKHALLIKHKLNDSELSCDYMEISVKMAKAINHIILENATEIVITSKEKVSKLI